jgi:hypothetical protein
MNDDIKHPVAKAASAGAVFLGGMTWGEVAQMLAAIYTACLVIEWLWKRVLKPLLQRSGVIKGQPRPFLDSTGAAPLDGK